ncbi:class I SAM-dependent methyltransferase [Sulfurimonas sp.]|uniref:class I SAM-dependent methyltransferase n=1 Tax=Sulfurimonas sp. TaxID=2022749 RepID=UPI003561D64D
MMKDIIKKAYQNVESLESYDKESLEEYRKNRLKQQIDVYLLINNFITENIKLLDIGSGSSALSYLLDNKEVLKFSDCVELSESRYNFAQKWKKDEDFFKVKNHNVEIGKYLFENDKYNLITCIDNTFSYIGLYNNENEIVDILNNIYDSLHESGYLILEVSLFANIVKQINSSDLDIIQEFVVNKGENFIALWEHRLLSPTIMNIKSKYISEDCNVKEKEENSRIFNLKELTNWLNNTGFVDIKIFSNFKQYVYIDGKSDKLVLVCKK